MKTSTLLCICIAVCFAGAAWAVTGAWRTALLIVAAVFATVSLLTALGKEK